MFAVIQKLVLCMCTHIYIIVIHSNIRLRSFQSCQLLLHTRLFIILIKPWDNYLRNRHRMKTIQVYTQIDKHPTASGSILSAHYNTYLPSTAFKMHLKASRFLLVKRISTLNELVYRTSNVHSFILVSIFIVCTMTPS